MNPEREDLNIPEYPHWPGDWPGRRFVNLDCIGDPGDWLDSELPSVEEVLAQHPQEDEAVAEALADAYIQKGKDSGFPLPTDCGDSEERMREVAIADFVGFIREWRRMAEFAGCFKPEKTDQQNPVATWDLLPSLGFVPDPQVISDVRPGLSRSFGDVKVSASCVMNLQFKEVVLFTGWLKTGRTISEICFEMPRHVESREQGVAWLVWGLEQAGYSHVFNPAETVPWLEEGQKHLNSLPWERESAAYTARPRCSLTKEWARLLFKTLAGHLAKVEAGAPVVFYFDGEVLTIRCAGNITAVAAQGNRWSQSHSIAAASLRDLPKRFMEPQIEVSVWDFTLRIGGRCYTGLCSEAAFPASVVTPGR